MKKTIIAFAAIIFITIFASSITVYAEDNVREATPTSSTTDIKTKEWEIRTQIENKRKVDSQKIEELKEIKKETVDKKCTTVTSDIDTRINRFNSNKTVHITEYTNMKNRIQAFITKLSTMGYDTSKLTLDLSVLDSKINQFASDYAMYISKLNDTKSFVCGKSEGEFHNALLSAKQALVVVHQDAVNIRSYYQTTIRPDIESLKQQKKTTEASKSASTK